LSRKLDECKPLNGGAIKLTMDDKRNLALLRSIAQLVSPDLGARLGAGRLGAQGGTTTADAVAEARRQNGAGAAGVSAAGAGAGAGAGPSTMSAEEVQRLVATVRELGPAVAPGVRRMGRGLHSSTSPLNLSRA